MADQLRLLQEAAEDENCVFINESMKKHTTFRIGGPADFLAAPTTREGISNVVGLCREQGWPFTVIGNGSNLLVSDKGYRGVVLQLYKNFSSVQVEGNRMTAQSGANLSVIAKRAQESALAGFEFASGIPGTLGGAVVMNAGAYGGEMKDVLISADVLTEDGKIREIPAGDLALGYRTSAVSENGWIVLGAKIALDKGDSDQILNRMEELKERRVTKQPLDLPSAGSTFKRPEGYFAGKLITDAGLKGFRVGDAMVSKKHAGFVVNAGHASAADVLQLIREVQERVFLNSGVRLEPEIKLLGDFD